MDPETKGWKHEWAHLPLEDSVLPVPSTPGMTRMVVMVLKEGTLLPEDAGKGPIELQAMATTRTLWTP